MQSDGGLSPVSAFSGHKAILSGPAGGYATLQRQCPVTRCNKMCCSFSCLTPCKADCHARYSLLLLEGHR